MKEPATQGGAKSADTTGRPPQLTYPIPNNDETLRSEHLHQLAMLAVRQSALGAQAGIWGLYVPPGLAAGACNIVTIGDGVLTVDNLSVLTSSGIAIQAQRLETRLEASATEAAVLTVFWALPERAISPDKPAPLRIGLSLSGVDKADATEVLGRIETGVGRRALLQWIATAPVVTLGGTPETTRAATALSVALEALAEAVHVSARVPLFERLLVRASLMSSRSQLMVGTTTSALAGVCEALMSCLALMRAFGSGGDAKLAQQLEAEMLPPPNNGAEAVLVWMAKTSRQLDGNEAMLTWLRGTVRGLVPIAGFPISIGGSTREFRYAVPKEGPRQLHVTFEIRDNFASTGALYPSVLVRFGGDTFRHLALERSERGFAATVERDGEDGDLELRVPSPIEPIVTINAGA
ncbi:hypothetical protein M2212_006229 [Bradyrhizobium elkanii]|uniref:hypothetical protein n=1 Tax=Bradyrhizobium elkanii TaxID=29448 RepID=UPI002166DA9A|nr:hypothetical protein [Bradyrhizobium elkanii]MCS3479383.1 hypothetical protein [Bradyrhizobium elkanii]